MAQVASNKLLQNFCYCCCGSVVSTYFISQEVKNNSLRPQLCRSNINIRGKQGWMPLKGALIIKKYSWRPIQGSCLMGGRFSTKRSWVSDQTCLPPVSQMTSSSTTPYSFWSKSQQMFWLTSSWTKWEGNQFWLGVKSCPDWPVSWRGSWGQVGYR